MVSGRKGIAWRKSNTETGWQIIKPEKIERQAKVFVFTIHKPAGERGYFDKEMRYRKDFHLRKLKGPINPLIEMSLSFSNYKLIFIRRCNSPKEEGHKADDWNLLYTLAGSEQSGGRLLKCPSCSLKQTPNLIPLQRMYINGNLFWHDKLEKRFFLVPCA